MISEKVSVLIPMYNVEKYISRCIESVLCQTYTNIEIILVDDGSKDNTYEIALSYAKEDCRIKLFLKDNEKNVSKTRNFLLDKITGDYFVFIDSDDYIENNYIESLYNEITKHKADCAICNYKIELFSSKIHRLKKIKSFEKNNIDALKKIVLETFPSSFMLWNKIYKTSVLGDLKFNEECRYGEDFNFMVHFFTKCKKVCFFNQKLYHYYIRPGSEMHQGFSSKHIDFIKVLDKDINNEENPDAKNILACWTAFSAAGFLLEATFKHYNNGDDINYLKEIALKYEDIFIQNKRINKLYKNLYKIVKTLLIN